MTRISRIEGKIIQLLKNQERLFVGDIFVAIESDKRMIIKSIRRLVEKDIIRKEYDGLREYLRLSVEYKDSYYEKIFVCPICNTQRKILNKNQLTALCANPGCRTPKGYRTVFRLVKPTYVSLNEAPKEGAP